ncbi:MAG: hypothetical protein K6C11_00045 [Bacilli bacterium]|nr:hypothetical protein [Bacilli bacterium]
MEKKRINISIVLLILILTVGFATVTTSLIITGSTKISINNNFNVYFSSATADSGSNITITNGKQNIKFDSEKLQTVGDTVTLNYTVYNNSANYDAEVHLDFYIYPYDTRSFTITRTGFDQWTTTIVPAKGSVNGSMVVTLIKPVVDDISYSFDISLDAYAIERNSFVSDTTLNDISSVSELIAAFSNGGRYKLTSDLDIRGLGELPVTSDLDLDFNGYTITSDINQINLTTGYLTLQATHGGGILAERGCVNVTGGELIIMNGNYAATDSSGGAVISVDGGNLTINNGSLDGAFYAIDAKNFENVFINGGHIKSSNDSIAYAVAFNNGEHFAINGGWIDGTFGGVWTNNVEFGGIYDAYVTAHDKYVDGVKQNHTQYALYMSNSEIAIDRAHLYSEDIIDENGRNIGAINIYNDGGLLDIYEGYFSSNVRFEDWEFTEYAEPIYDEEHNAFYKYEKGGPQ